MGNKKEHICRICLKVTNNEFEDRGELIEQIFDILLLRLNFDIIKDLIICHDCMEVAKKCLSFKYTYINTEKIILSYSTDKRQIKNNIKEIYEERKYVPTVFNGDINICRFCMTRFEINNFVSLTTLINETVFDILSEYMAEIDFNNIESPMTCGSCRENLDVYFKFVLNCLNTEEKIKEYCKEKETDNIGQDILEYPNKYSHTWKMKQDHSECEYPTSYIGSIKQEELHIKNEEINLNEISYRGTFSPKEYETTSDFQSHVPVGTGIYSKNKCLVCGYQAKQISDYKRHILVHMDASELEMHKCPDCGFESKYKTGLKSHMLVHKDASKIKMHKCSLCAFESKRKNTLTIHMLLHKDVSEINMHKCSLCTYETRLKSNLLKHMLVHKDVSELKMYKCSVCPYEAKHRYIITRHLLVHKDISEIKTHKCSLCAYQAKWKRSLTLHIMRVHKDESEMEIYKCSLCTFKSGYKTSLRNHMLVHKHTSEQKMYKCSLCPFESRHKRSLTNHNKIVHKGGSEIKIHKCSSCAFESKHKSSMNDHIVLHKDISQIEMHKCSLCAFESKHKRNLQTHMLVHKDPSEINMHKCSLCAYEARLKCHLKTHMIVHKDPSEIKMYKCSMCVTMKQNENIPLRDIC